MYYIKFVNGRKIIKNTETEETKTEGYVSGTFGIYKLEKEEQIKKILLIQGI